MTKGEKSQTKEMKFDAKELKVKLLLNAWWAGDGSSDQEGEREYGVESLGRNGRKSADCL